MHSFKFFNWDIVFIQTKYEDLIGVIDVKTGNYLLMVSFYPVSQWLYQSKLDGPFFRPQYDENGKCDHWFFSLPFIHISRYFKNK